VKRIAIGPVASIGGAVLLIVALFLDWFEPDINAWKAFEVLDLVLMGLAIAVISGALDRLDAGLRATPRLEHAVLPLSAATLVIVLSQILNHPPAAIGRGNEIGIYLAIGGAALMVAGAVAAVARISVAVEPRGRSAPPAAPKSPSSEDPTEIVSGNVD
jgi:hypothetical protein